MHEIVITIGDWSEDGHNRYDMFTFESSHTKKELQAAYKKSCIKSGVSFDHEYNGGHEDPNAICTTYKSDTITAYQMFMLHKTFGLDISDIPENVKNFSMNGLQPNAKELAHIILWFVGCSLDNFTRTSLVPKKRKQDDFEKWADKTFNGWWGKLNVQMGYGIYDSTFSLNINRNHCKPLSDTKLYILDDKNINGYLAHIEHLKHVRMKPKLSLRYDDELRKSVREWAKEHFHNNVFKVGDIWFYEDIRDIHLIKKHFKTEKFISDFMPHCISIELPNDHTNEKRNQLIKICEESFGVELYPDSEYPTKMLDFNEDSRWCHIVSIQQKSPWGYNYKLVHNFYFKSSNDAMLFKLKWR
jgi:hypothetical protein